MNLRSRTVVVQWAVPLVIALSCFPVREASAQLNERPPEVAQVDVVEHLRGSLPLDAKFRDQSGKPVTIGDEIDAKKPSILIFTYHSCPMLCSLVLDAVTKAIREIPWTVDIEYNVLSISIDPRDTPETATKKRAQVMQDYGRPGTENGWRFLVGDEQNIRRATEAVGFQFQYDKRQEQYAHPAAIFLLTPTGTIARYLYGIEFKPSDVRLGLLEASEGRSISTIEKLILYCYHYDPQGKKYSLVAMNTMRVGGVLTMAFLVGLFAILKFRRRRVPTIPQPSTNLNVP